SAEAAPLRVVMRREALPMDLLVVRERPSDFAAGVVQSREQMREARRDIEWAGKREYVFAAIAAGWHIAVFSFNLAFWGNEGMPSDRYWPANPRVRLQIRPGRYGTVEGTRRVYMDYLAKSEGVSGGA
ncbi:hypothetical protein TSOC_007097, partial [Tetrabaena socialis]